jgi:hypothetical protein
MILILGPFTISFVAARARRTSAACSSSSSPSREGSACLLNRASKKGAAHDHTKNLYRHHRDGDALVGTRVQI